MKTVKAWALVSPSGQLTIATSGKARVYLSKREAQSWNINDKVVRVEIRPIKKSKAKRNA